MNLEKFTVHNWPEGKSEYYLAWYPESEPYGLFWGPISNEFIREDIMRRIITADNFKRMHKALNGIAPLPDACYVSEQGLTNYR